MLAFAVQANEPGEVAVEKHVASEDQARVALAQERGGAPDSASRAEEIRLVGKGKSQARRAVAFGRRLKDFGQIVGIDDHLRHTERCEFRQRIGDEGQAPYGERGLWAQER